MPKDRPEKDIKVTDKRIFTAEGDIREEFRNDIRPADPTVRPAEPPAAKPAEPTSQKPQQPRGAGADHGRTVADKASNPGTPFANFIEPLVLQTYMSLGMLKNPYQPQAKVDPAAARQMIDILTLLEEKTRGNLTPEENDFLSTHVGDLKLAYVQRTKNL